jgi:(E)-4-hydroxy-3-methylbut-2-enyl-diphosphate synthase
MGGNNPIRIQSMTTVDTMDTAGSVAQSIRMIEAGCEYVRITAPSMKEAKNLEAIRKELSIRGYHTPLIADIHFTPNAAELAARLVQKVRINPGNYADKKRFEQIDYSDAAYESELQRIREKFLPLIKICKEYGTAMRIGTNHGSLSDRIMSRYGDTPIGMVESALEFLRICEAESYFNIVLSMKASNPQVMVQAYRLLVNKLDSGGFKSYPLHLGVTEAGDGEDGRVKSAVGIGTLLEDGLGDTIRVSLTEEPEAEIPVARMLADRYSGRSNNPVKSQEIYPIHPFEYIRRITGPVLNIGGHQVPVVIADLSAREKLTHASFFSLGYGYSVPLDKWNIADNACDYIFTGSLDVDFEIPGTLGIIQNYRKWIDVPARPRHYPLIAATEFLSNSNFHPELNFVRICISDLTSDFFNKLRGYQGNVALVFYTQHDHGMAEQRSAMAALINHEIKNPVILERSYSDRNEEIIQLHASTDFGALLIDGLGDGVFLFSCSQVSERFINNTLFNILQATRTRISKTEYISCPSCGRTLFDLQETTAKIRSRTYHLKGVKIGIMGCIVNGPGEMADADYGYVGSGPGRINLYRGKEVVKRNVPTEKAVDELIGIIREDGQWIELSDN